MYARRAKQRKSLLLRNCSASSAVQQLICPASNWSGVVAIHVCTVRIHNTHSTWPTQRKRRYETCLKQISGWNGDWGKQTPQVAPVVIAQRENLANWPSRGGSWSRNLKESKAKGFIPTGRLAGEWIQIHVFPSCISIHRIDCTRLSCLLGGYVG